MLHIFTDKASKKIKEAHRKTSYLVACFCVFVSLLFFSPVQANEKQSIEMNLAYEQIFGKQFINKKHHNKNITKSPPNNIDLAVAYRQLFLQKKKPRTISSERPKNKISSLPVKKVEIKPVVIKANIQDEALVPAIKISQEKTTIATVNEPSITSAIIETPAPSKATSLDALFAKAFGKKSTSSAPSKVTVELRINKTVLGDVTVFSNKQGQIDSVDKEEFLTLFKDIVKDKVYKKIVIQVSNKRRIPFELLSKEGIYAEYSSVDLSLDLKIKTILRKPLILSMQSKRGASVRNENKIKPEEYSGFLNLYSNTVFVSGATKPLLNMKFEGSFSVGNTVFESALDIRDGSFSTDRTRLTYDKPEKLQRFMLGDISTGSRNFQENLSLNGLRVSKEFYMNPDLQIRPKANESFDLPTDSEVEVLINGQLKQRFYLRAGIYSLEDIGLYDGANNIRVRIKDEFGKITEKTSQQFYESNLLKKELSVYAFSVGYLSSKQVGASNQLIKNPIVSGYYQKGISKNLTIGVDAQVSANAYLLGSEMIRSEYLGIIKSSIAISGGSDKSSGAATRFEFKPNKLATGYKLWAQNDTLINWRVSGELRSKNFSLLNSSDTIDVVSGDNKKQLKARLQTNVGLHFNDDWRGSLNVSLSDYYDNNNNVGVNLLASRRFINSINLNLGAHYDSDDKFSVNLQLSIPLSNINKKRKGSLDILANTKTNTFESKLSMAPHSEIGRNSLAGSLEYIQSDTSKQQNLDIQYRDVSFETSLKARNSFIESDNQSSQQLNIGFNTSLACAGRECAISSPINDSFALVSGPSNQTIPIAINNGNSHFFYSDTNISGLPDNYTALIPGKNKKAVVKLKSYRYQSINIAESTLPNGYDTDKTEFEVFPRYHQGFLIKAGGEPATILSGVLVNDKNKPLGFKGGQWVPEKQEGKTIAFFSNKGGFFRITSIPAGKYKLELFDYPDMDQVNVNIPDLKGKVYDLGEIKISE